MTVPYVRQTSDNCPLNASMLPACVIAGGRRFQSMEDETTNPVLKASVRAWGIRSLNGAPRVTEGVGDMARKSRGMKTMSFRIENTMPFRGFGFIYHEIAFLI